MSSELTLNISRSNAKWEIAHDCLPCFLCVNAEPPFIVALEVVLCISMAGCFVITSVKLVHVIRARLAWQAAQLAFQPAVLIVPAVVVPPAPPLQLPIPQPPTDEPAQRSSAELKDFFAPE